MKASISAATASRTASSEAVATSIRNVAGDQELRRDGRVAAQERRIAKPPTSRGERAGAVVLADHARDVRLRGGLFADEPAEVASRERRPRRGRRRSRTRRRSGEDGAACASATPTRDGELRRRLVSPSSRSGRGSGARSRRTSGVRRRRINGEAFALRVEMAAATAHRRTGRARPADSPSSSRGRASTGIGRRRSDVHVVPPKLAAKNCANRVSRNSRSAERDLGSQRRRPLRRRSRRRLLRSRAHHVAATIDRRDPGPPDPRSRPVLGSCPGLPPVRRLSLLRGRGA